MITEEKNENIEVEAKPATDTNICAAETEKASTDPGQGSEPPVAREKVKGRTKAAVAVVCAASIICVPFFAASGANVSEQAKVAEADMQVEKTVIAENEPDVDEAPIGITELSNAVTAQELADQLVVNTVGVSYADMTISSEDAEKPAEESPDETDPEEVAETAEAEEPEKTEEEEINEGDASNITKEDEPQKEYALGDKNTFVAKIQSRLMELNYMEDDSPTTLFGPLTSQAISYFQRKNGLSMTGVADSKTLDLLFSSSAKSYTATEGARGDDIILIQERLNELGYTCTADGYFGAKTKAALMAFQTNNNLTADGTVGPHTKEILFSSSAKKATKNDTVKPDDSKTDDKKDDSKTDDKKDDKKDDNKSDDKKDDKKDDNKSDDSKDDTSNSNELKGDNSNAPKPNSSKVEALISAAESLLGKPYVYGGKGPDEFDCSGFVYYALNKSGFSIGYMTSGGWASSGYATIYGMKNLKRGDIVCFSGHVGIYLGGDDMIDASTAQGKIRKYYGISDNSYWRERFICGKRPLV